MTTIIMKEHYAVWVETYDTFGSHGSHIYARYVDREVAETEAKLLGASWGNRTRVEHVAGEEIDDTTTVKDLLERYSYLKASHPALFQRPAPTERRKARKKK